MVRSDFDGDGDGDVLFQNDRSGQLIFAAMAGGNFEGFGAASGGLGNYLVGGYGDIGGNGFADIVLQNPANGQLVVAFQNGSGTPNYVNLARVPGWRPVGVADINGDGFADIVIQNQATDAIGYEDVHNGTFRNVTTLAGFAVVGVGDVNGDGSADIAIQNFATGQIEYWTWPAAPLPRRSMSRRRRVGTCARSAT